MADDLFNRPPEKFAQLPVAVEDRAIEGDGEGRLLHGFYNEPVD
mgnify:CR=1 FL=1